MNSEGGMIPEKVIVELSIPQENSTIDALLPTQMPIKTLKIGILRQLKEYMTHIHPRTDGIQLYYRENPLPEESTLESVGAWDGSTIVVELR